VDGRCRWAEWLIGTRNQRRSPVRQDDPGVDIS